MGYWRIAPGRQGFLWSEQRDNECIALGWNGVGDLKSYKNMKELGKEIKKHYKSSPRQLWKFYKEVCLEDKILANSGNEIYGLGIIKNGYKFNDDLTYKNSKPVNWYKKYWAPVYLDELSLPVDLVNKLTRNRTIKDLSKQEWELIEDPTSGEVIRETPLVNVFFDQETFNGIQSNPVEQQRADGVFTIDCLATKVHEKNADGTISRGDELAARDVQRVVRLVRNILMAGFYTYLNMRGVVSQRDIQSVTMFQPNINDRPAQHVIGCRVNVAVNYNEFSPQVEPVELDLVSLQCTRAEDGFLYFTNSFDYNL